MKIEVANTKIKLCGLFRDIDAEYVNKLKPDYAGFVINFPKSHRSIDETQANRLRQMILSDIKTVGVFVNEPPENCADLANEGIINLIQLHGNESKEYVEQLRRLTDVPLIKAVKVKSREDIEEAEKLDVDYLLLDGGTGEGKTFNHAILEGMTVKKPFFMAGGLTPENVSVAISRFNPYGVDVSSALETDKVKDIRKMTAFVEAVKSLSN